MVMKVYHAIVFWVSWWRSLSAHKQHELETFVILHTLQPHRGTTPLHSQQRQHHDVHFSKGITRKISRFLHRMTIGPRSFTSWVLLKPTYPQQETSQMWATWYEYFNRNTDASTRFHITACHCRNAETKAQFFLHTQPSCVLLFSYIAECWHKERWW